MAVPPFHLAFPVDDLGAARAFYGELLGCPEGRSADDWVDFDLFGHQIVAHLAPEAVRVRGDSLASTQTRPSWWWKVEGRFTSPTTAQGTYRQSAKGAACDTRVLKWTARRAGD